MTNRRTISRIEQSSKQFDGNECNSIDISAFRTLKSLHLKNIKSGMPMKGLRQAARTLMSIFCEGSLESPQQLLTNFLGESGPDLQSRFLGLFVDERKSTNQSEWSQLMILGLSRNEIEKIDSIAAASFAPLVNLTRLDLSHNKIAYVADMSSLIELSMRTFQGGNIKELIIDNNKLTTLEGLERLKGLELLSVQENMISRIANVGLIGKIPLHV
ncbi:MAG: hypothetical protein EZS28_011711 [Streblomastix strix]|uniref:Uncharacterized protein n=1 Tax=Streblomastix strix TaxID=222440 RepID=A0A5J4WCT2_9EUKA|nr:MAG: hypothetical protein EZS28_011711 [Streblomastix strix]